MVDLSMAMLVITRWYFDIQFHTTLLGSKIAWSPFASSSPNIPAPVEHIWKKQLVNQKIVLQMIYAKKEKLSDFGQVLTTNNHEL